MSRVCVRILSVFLLIIAFSLTTFGSASAQDSCGMEGGEEVTFLVPTDVLAAAESVLCSVAEENGIFLSFASEAPNVYNDFLQEAPASLLYVPSLSQLNDLVEMNALVTLDEIDDSTISEYWRGMGLISLDGENANRYGLPVDAYVTSSLVWYNPQVFESNGFTVPSTYDDFLFLLQQVSDSGLIPVALNEATLTNAFFDILSRSQGDETIRQLLTEEGSFMDESVVAGLQTFQDLALNYFRVYGAEDGDARLAPFGPDPSAAMTVASGSTDQVLASMGAIDLLDYGTQYAFFPLPTADGSPGATQSAASFVAATVDTDGTRVLLNYLASPEGAAAWAQARNQLSPNGEVEIDYESRPALNDLAALMQGVAETQHFLLTAGVTVGDAYSDINDSLRMLATGETDAESAAGTMQDSFSQSSRRWYRCQLRWKGLVLCYPSPSPCRTYC